jgi:hypothetical protein
MRQDLLNKINDLAVSLAKVSTWNTSKDAFGHIIKYNDGKEKIAEDNYIYEFYCLMKIIEDLHRNPNHKIKFIKGNGIFPRNPTSKKNKPYFVLEANNKEIFQICSGTQIQTVHTDVKKAPDISFQSMTSNNELPSYKDVLVIYDAKYSEAKGDKSFQEGQMALFNRMIRLLKLETPTQISYYFTHYSNFNGNCILTNKKSYTDDVAELRAESITVVQDFDENKIFSVI